MTMSAIGLQMITACDADDTADTALLGYWYVSRGGVHELIWSRLIGLRNHQCESCMHALVPKTAVACTLTAASAHAASLTTWASAPSAHETTPSPSR